MKWNGRNYKPLLPQKIRFKEEKFDVEEYMKSLQEKHDRVPVWRTIPNPIAVNVSVSEGPLPTPSITPSNTPTPSITPSPTFTPTSTITPTPTGTPVTSPTATPTPTPTQLSGATQAYAFLERVVQSGGTLNSTISAATINLFTSIVSNNLWDSIDVFYPIIGGNAQGHCQAAGSRVINTNPNLIFNGGWTHSVSGMTPNGVNAYATTQYSPRATVATNFVSLGAYVNETDYDGTVMGFIDAETDIYQIRLRPSTNQIDAQPSVTIAGAISSSLTGSSGFYMSVRTNNTDTFVVQNSGITLQTQAVATMDPNLAVWIGARNYGPSPDYGDKRISFVFMGRDMSTTNALILRNIVQQFQVDLSRNSV
jgi:hypothetical protein